MNPSLIEYGSIAFWERLGIRLEPLMGDVERKLGRCWMDQFETCFSVGDFETVTLAREGRFGKASFVLSLQEAAYPLCDFIDDLQAAPSEAQCVALLLDVCKSADLWPTRITIDADGLTFWQDTHPFATVHAVEPSPEIAPATRTRAQSLLGGISKYGDAPGELGRRIARWPGLASMRPGESTLRSNAHAHWPCPSEWLIAARRLWALAGIPDAGTAQVQELAAAVFGSPDWHQLCAAMPTGATDGDWWALQGPFRVTSEGQPPETRLHTDALAAFVDFAGRAAVACRGPDRFTCSISRTVVTDVPVLTIALASCTGESTMEAFHRLGHGPLVMFFPVRREAATPESLAIVQAPLAARDCQLLLHCFALDSEDDVRSNRIFHSAEYGSVRCDGIVCAGGPTVVVGDDGAPIGCCALRKFGPGRMDDPEIPEGWWLVKYDAQRRGDLTTLSDAQARDLAQEFGIPIYGETPWIRLEGFYTSPAWEGLRRWCREHPKIASSYKGF